MGGVSLSPFAMPKNLKQRVLELAEQEGCTSDSTEQMVKCLQQRPPEKLVSFVDVWVILFTL